MTDPAPGVHPARSVSSWTARLPLATGLVVCAIALWAITPVPVGAFWDDGVYLISAKAIATGAGYHFVHLPGAPPAVHFPPGYPALLAMVWLLRPGFPENVAWLKLVNPLLLGVMAGLACSYGIRRLRLPPLVAAGAVLVTSAALPVLVMTGVLFSEPLFAALLFAALLATERAVTESGVRRALTAGILVGALCLARTAGVAMIPALIGALLLSRRPAAGRDALIAGAGALALIAPWQFWLATRVDTLAPTLRGSYGPYLDWVLALYRERGAAFAFVIVRENVLSIYRTLGIALFPFGPRALRPLLVALVFVVAGFGLLAVVKRAKTMALFLACYLAMVLAWPYAPDRFVWAVWPLLGLLVALGATEAWRAGVSGRETPGLRATAALACTVGAFAFADHAAYSVRGLSRQWNDVAARTNVAALMPVAAWINANTSANDIIACDGEPFIHLYTGRTVVPVHILSPDEYLAGTPLEQGAADLRALMLAHRPTYAVFSAASADAAAAPLVDGSNATPRLELVESFPGGGAAYRVHLP